MNKALELLQNSAINLLKKAYKAGGNTDKVVIGLGAVGMIVSMLAQLSSIKSNKKLSDEKRTFLLHQETVDGLTNTALFFGFTTLLSSIVKKQMDTGRILTPQIKAQLEQAAIKLGKTYEQIIKDAKTSMNKETLKSLKKGEKNCDIGTVVENSKIFEEVKRLADAQTPKKQMENEQAEADIFATTKSGLAMIATIVGSVISNNIISPIVRNKISNDMQEKYNAEHPKVAPYPKQMLTPSIYNKKNTFTPFSSITKI